MIDVIVNNGGEGFVLMMGERKRERGIEAMESRLESIIHVKEKGESE